MKSTLKIESEIRKHKTKKGYEVSRALLKEVYEQVCYDWQERLRAKFPGIEDFSVKSEYFTFRGNGTPDPDTSETGARVLRMNPNPAAAGKGLPFGIAWSIAPPELRGKALYYHGSDFEVKLVTRDGINLILFKDKKYRPGTDRPRVYVSNWTIRELHKDATSLASEWQAFLKKHFPDAFVKPEPKAVYKMGQRFVHTSPVSGQRTEYILSKCGPHYSTGNGIPMALINLSSGNLWTDPISVGDLHEITKAEMEKICGGKTRFETSFELIK